MVLVKLQYLSQLIKLNILNSRIENYDFNNRKRYLTLVNNVWKNSNIGIEENNDTGVKEEFTYNNNYCKEKNCVFTHS